MTRASFALIILAIVIGSVRAASAQTPLEPPSDTAETNRPSIIPFLEGTDVFWSLQKSNDLEDKPFPYKLEADIFPHLVAVQNFTDALTLSSQERRGIDGLKEFTYSISGTPAVRIRMLRELSAPVRTPSYMPRGNFQFLWVRGLKDCATTADRNAREQCSKAPVAPGAAAKELKGVRPSVFDALRSLERVSIWEAHFIIGHHSNGQEGCLITGQVRNESDECLPAATVTAANVNGVSGSFSTNYFRVGVNYSRNWMEPALLQATREARLRVEWEYHPRPWVSSDIVEVYGRSRLNAEAAYAAGSVPVCKKRIEGSVSVVWNPGLDVEDVTKGSVAAQASCFPTHNGGWGFFARFYKGEDYYNVAFVNDITRLQFGATFNQSGFFRFRRAVGSAK